MTQGRLYSIGELARLAGVTVRTIRYYIQEGLLPEAPLRGRYAGYDESYLDLLEQIRRMKEDFLPLREIRNRLERGAAAGRIPEEAPESAPGFPDLSTSPVLANFCRASPYLYAESRLESMPSLKGEQEGSQWERLELAEGLELHVRQPNRHPALLRALVDLAREFSRGE
ncbi:MAG: MerR family transcriptional regulator [Candidatus Krumholzibacteria bacterium]|jgi:DNA-binding transcriptional MerR regulator|nr:MerR family transcriptional regulator [Candidatus Krumholzibacteria bacterium]MDP6668896.1 MerR family transcriptional regulator [Candidatus Krumholzibacteria bacterium]MDP6797024.1 MerR family transcriptional regulator [Candidatus Krumholzibacteria bacterium]MDP7022380.1 MerR family transcriptional regulator [Candidatus Krumholzibacteria bacterium]